VAAGPRGCSAPGEAWHVGRLAPGHRAGRFAAGALIIGVTLLAAGCRKERDDAEIRASLEEATITAEVRSRLLMAPDLERLPLEVRTRDGTVAVSGVVRDSTQAASIRAIAERVRGVRRVELDLRLEPPPDSAAADSARSGTGPAPARKRREREARPDTSGAPRESVPSLDEAG
jgi:hypothetical protein